MTDIPAITKEGREKFLRYAKTLRENPRMMPVGIEMLSKALSYEAALTAVEKERDELREALIKYSNPDIYKPHPHGPAFDDRDLSFIARAALKGRE